MTTKNELTKAYESMKAKHPDAILLFHCGDFYEAYADDAKAVSEVLGIILTRTSRKDITAQMAGFPAHALGSYLPRLVRAGKRVAICDELSAPQPSALAESIKAVMAEHGITQRELAKKLGTHPVVVNSTIHNPNVKVSTLQRYADAIGCTLADFFSR